MNDAPLNTTPLNAAPADDTPVAVARTAPLSLSLSLGL